MKHTLCIARITEDGRTYFTATYDGGVAICPQRDTYAEILPALDRVVSQSKVLRVTLWDGTTEYDLPGVPRDLSPVLGSLGMAHRDELARAALSLAGREKSAAQSWLREDARGYFELEARGLVERGWDEAGHRGWPEYLLVLAVATNLRLSALEAMIRVTEKKPAKRARRAS